MGVLQFLRHAFFAIGGMYSSVCTLYFVITLLASSVTCGILNEELPWATARQCAYEGKKDAYLYTLSGDDTSGVHLVIKAESSTSVPNFAAGEDWKRARPCFEALTKLTLDGMKSIEARAFYGLTRLAEVEAPSLLEIGDYAFAMSGVTLAGFQRANPQVGKVGNERIVISEGAFQFCQNFVGDYVAPTALRYLGENAYQGTGITSVDMSQTITLMSYEGVFWDCVNLKVYQRGGNARMSLKESMFEGDYNLESFIGVAQTLKQGQFLVALRSKRYLWDLRLRDSESQHLKAQDLLGLICRVAISCVTYPHAFSRIARN